MDALLSLIPGGQLTAIGAMILAGLLAVWRIFAAGKASQRAKQDKADLDAMRRAKDIDDKIASRDAETNRKELGKWGI